MSQIRMRVIVQLEAVSGLGAGHLNEIFQTLALYDMSVEDIDSCTGDNLVHRFGLAPDQADEFVRAHDHAEKLLERIDSTAISLITLDDELWPMRPVCPTACPMKPWIWIAGDLSILNTSTLGIVGSRDATPRSLEITRELAHLAVAQDVAIVSGGARGVDNAAHNAALEAGGQTVVVLAQGIATYNVPPQWREPIGQGRLTLVSEFAPFASWESHQALQRNATAVRLNDAFVVVQAEAKSGTSSAGRSALRMKRPLHVVSQTGDGAERFEGNEQLIRQGGRPLEVPIDRPLPTDAVTRVIQTEPAASAQAGQLRLF